MGGGGGGRGGNNQKALLRDVREVKTLNIRWRREENNFLLIRDLLIFLRNKSFSRYY